MSTVRAKFNVVSITKSIGGTNVQMYPVYSGSEENKAFNDHTPGGQIQIHIAEGKPAAELFEVGKEYYVDFTPADTLIGSTLIGNVSK